MEAVSGLIIFFIWACVFLATKNKAQQKSSSAKKKRTAASNARKMPEDSSEQSQVRRQEVKKTKASAQKPKTVYTAVCVPKPEKEGEANGHTAHMVRPLADHAHEETSLTGFTDCPPEIQSEAKAEPVPAPIPVGSFAFTREEAYRAILCSEILSKPKALRKE